MTKDNQVRGVLSKVLAVTLGFWIIKILATTLGETGGDSVSMTWLGETTPGAAQSAVNGYLVGTAIFGVALAVLAMVYFTTRISHVLLFWAAFILTRPLGATVGDFLDRPFAKGGLEVSRPIATAVLAAAIVALIVLLLQRAGAPKTAAS